MDFLHIQKKFKKIWKAHPTALALVVFAVLIAIFYGNSLQNDGFILDDRWLIENNPYIQSVQYLQKAVTGCIWESLLVDGCKSVGIHYRPVLHTSFLVTWQISSSPQFFHFINLVYFLLVAFLTFVLTKLLTKNTLAAFLAGTLFLIHPVNNEVANWIVAVSESTFALFILLTAIFYILYHQKKSTRYLSLTYLSYFLAMLSKEPAVFVVPLLILLLDLVIFRIPFTDLFRKRHILKRYLLFAIPFAVYFIMRILVLGFSGAFLLSRDYATSFSLSERIYAAVTLFVQFIRQLFFPYPLKFFHSFSFQENLFTLPFILSLSGVVIFFLLIWMSQKHQKNTTTFLLFWIALFLSPMLIFFDMSKMQVFFDRYMFVSSIGFAMLFGYGIALFVDGRFLRNHKRRKKNLLVWQSYLFFKHQHIRKNVTILAISILLIISWFIIYPRNRDWKDPVVFYPITLQQSPDAYFMRRELGYVYMNREEFEKAREEFEYIIANAPSDWEEITMAYKGLGDYYRAQEDDENTLLYYQRAADTSNRSARDYIVYSDIGALSMNKEHYLRGFVNFCQASALLPNDQGVQDNLNKAFSLVQTEYVEQSLLYGTIQDQLQKAERSGVVYLDQRCPEDADICQYAFRLQFEDERPEIFPPFLFAAQAESEEVVEITNRSLSENNIVVFETSNRYQDKTITFLFPNCQGRYYEAKTSIVTSNE